MPPEDLATVQSIVDSIMAKWLVQTTDRGRLMVKSDLQGLGRPERYDMLIELGEELTGIKVK